MTIWMVNPASSSKRRSVARKWIRKAVKHPGAFTRKAQRAGMTVHQYARHVLREGSRASTKTKRQAQLALNLEKMARKRSSNPNPRRSKVASRNRKRDSRGRFLKGGGTTRRRKRNPPRKRTTRRRTTARRRTYRRNPPRTRKPKLVKRLTDGLIDALYATGGKAAARVAADRIPTPEGMVVGGFDLGNIAVQLGVAAGIGFAADMFLPAKRAEIVVAGALMGPVESAIRSANIPYLSSALSSYPIPAPARLGMLPFPTPGRRKMLGSYPQPGRSMGRYPRAVGAANGGLAGAGMYGAGY